MPASYSALGKVTYDVTNRALSDAVGSFPAKISCARALALGLPDEGLDTESLVRGKHSAHLACSFHCYICTRFSLASYVVTLC